MFRMFAEAQSENADGMASIHTYGTAQQPV